MRLLDKTPDLIKNTLATALSPGWRKVTIGGVLACLIAGGVSICLDPHSLTVAVVLATAR